MTYTVSPRSDGVNTQVDIDVRALLAGPLAQFGRAGIVEEVAARLGRTFAANLERQMAAAHATTGDTALLNIGPLLGGTLITLLRSWFERTFGKSRT
jgi:carbon-monoxide dehydrogenase small subunit